MVILLALRKMKKIGVEVVLRLQLADSRVGHNEHDVFGSDSPSVYRSLFLPKAPFCKAFRR